MTDIVPDLQLQIEKTYKDLIEHDEVLSSLLKKIQSEGTWEDLQEYLGRIGKHRSTSFLENITSECLPNGQMYYNIADRTIRPELESDFEQLAEICAAVQERVNKDARIGIKALKPDLNTDRIDGIINRLCSEPYEDVKWLLGSPIENFMRSIGDDTVQKNIDFHYKSGLQPVIRRTTDGKCCKWCSERAGTYPYKPDMDREVFRRHENCGCTVAYYPDVKSKKKQNVWDKSWDYEDDRHAATKEERKEPDEGQNLKPENEDSRPKKDAKTQIARSVINSGEYRKAFDDLGESPKVTRAIYQATKNILEHRTETLFEDLVFVNPDTGETLVRNDFNEKQSVYPSKKMKEMVEANPNKIIAIHNHPNSSLPTQSDIWNARRYKYGLIAAHDGNVIKYEVSDKLKNEDLVYIDNLMGDLERNSRKGNPNEREKLLRNLATVGVKLSWINKV